MNRKKKSKGTVKGTSKGTGKSRVGKTGAATSFEKGELLELALIGLQSRQLWCEVNMADIRDQLVKHQHMYAKRIAISEATPKLTRKRKPQK